MSYQKVPFGAKTCLKYVYAFKTTSTNFVYTCGGVRSVRQKVFLILKIWMKEKNHSLVHTLHRSSWCLLSNSNCILSLHRHNNNNNIIISYYHSRYTWKRCRSEYIYLGEPQLWSSILVTTSGESSRRRSFTFSFILTVDGLEAGLD